MNITQSFIKNRKCTLLCAGPMSKNCIDAGIDLSKDYDIPIIFIASRRQIDADIFGGGYVEHFTTPDFVRYVKKQNAPRILFARDHGGPYQNNYESSKNMGVADSMASAKKSFEMDILCNFSFIHIDPSVPIAGESLSVDKTLERMFDLYAYCHDFAKKNNKDIEFELGTEEQKGELQDLEQFEYVINKTLNFCSRYRIKTPAFFVAQTGTKVLETQNMGVFSRINSFKPVPILEHIRKTVKLCERNGIMLKEHNADYLNTEALGLRPLLGIHASNIAPEFGTLETKALLYLLKLQGLNKEHDHFVELAMKSGKWKKWMIPGSDASDIDKAVICGHYIFSLKEVVEIKKKANKMLGKSGIDMDNYLKRIIKTVMLRYLSLFNVV